jgi:hypothetical protein
MSGTHTMSAEKLVHEASDQQQKNIEDHQERVLVGDVLLHP